MERSATTMLRIGAWCVDPASGVISRDDETTRLEARSMRLLLHLAEHAGEVVSIDELLEQIWQGVIVTPDSVYQAIASLRRLLGDDSRQPAYIATVPRLGYKLVAKVDRCADQVIPPRTRAAFISIAAIALLVGLFIVFAFYSNIATPEKSIAVLPFLDLTTEMNEGPFADGMTE